MFANLSTCRYVCRHARMETDMLIRIKMCRCQDRYAGGYEGDTHNRAQL